MILRVWKGKGGVLASIHVNTLSFEVEVHDTYINKSRNPDNHGRVRYGFYRLENAVETLCIVRRFELSKVQVVC